MPLSVPFHLILSSSHIQMYSGSGNWFVRKDYYYNSQSLVYKTDKFVIVALMGTSHRPVVSVKVFARKYEDLPGNAKKKITKESYDVE